MKAIILAGGKGTRLRPLTNDIPKALVPIGNSTLIELSINSLPASIDTVIITTKYLGNLIKEKLGTNFAHRKIVYAPQPPEQDGTWAAFYGAKDFIAEGEQFLLINCDDLFDIQELGHVVATGKIGMGVTQTMMPAKYHGMRITNRYINEFHRHTDTPKEELVEDVFANGLFLLDSKVFSFEPVKLIDNEYGLPQTLLAHKDDYPLFAHRLKVWKACNSLEDLSRLIF